MINYDFNALPIDWKIKKLGNIAKFLDGQRVPIKESDRASMQGPYPYYGASGIIDYVNDFIFDGDFILLGEDGANILNRSSPLAFRVSGKIWVNNHAHVIVPKPYMDISFLTEYLESISYVKYNTGTAQPKLPQLTCAKIDVIVPPLPEQRKIAEIISTWDEAITKTKQLIAALQQRKKALMQHLLNGDMRFPGFESEWEKHKFGDLLKPIVRREKVDPHKNYSLIGVRWYVAGAHIHGTVSGNQIATSELSRIHENDILYNKMWVTKNAFAIARKEHNGAYGSAEYPQFVPKLNKIDVNFLGFFFHNPRFQHDAHRLCKGTTGRARLNPGDFLEIEVMIPKIEEQIKITELLGCCEKEIELFSRKLDALKQQKKGLMQRLLTGQVRVKV